MPAVIKTEDLSHVYSAGTPFEKTAVGGVNLSIEEGEFVGVIGHTGSGKSTLIQHFNGLLKAYQGQNLCGWTGYLGKQAGHPGGAL